MLLDQFESPIYEAALSLRCVPEASIVTVAISHSCLGAGLDINIRRAARAGFGVQEIQRMIQSILVISAPVNAEFAYLNPGESVFRLAHAGVYSSLLPWGERWREGNGYGEFHHQGWHLCHAR